MKKILVPTDFSQNAEDAMKYSLDLIGSSSAEIELFHAINLAVAYVETPTTSSIAMVKKIDEAKKSLAKQVIRAKKYAKENEIKNVKITSNFTLGDAANNIISEAKDYESDVIVMGTKGENYAAIDKILGTVSSQILKAPCPVILVPGGYKFKDIDNVIFPTKLEHSDPYELNKAMSILEPRNTVVQCLHLVENEDDKNDKELKDFAKYIINHSPTIQTTFYTELGDDISSKVEKYADNYDAELVIVPRKEKSLFQRIFSKNHIKEMIWIAKRPLMIVN